MTVKNLVLWYNELTLEARGVFMKTDIEIAQSIELKPIVDVVEKLGISYDDLELYGKYKG